MRCGGLLRVVDGHFLMAFFCHLPEPSDFLQAELWSVLMRLR